MVDLTPFERRVEILRMRPIDPSLFRVGQRIVHKVHKYTDFRVESRVTDIPSLSMTEEFPGMRDFQSDYWDSSRQTRMVDHPYGRDHKAIFSDRRLQNIFSPLGVLTR